MNWQPWFTGLVILVAFLAMARDLVPPAVAIMGGVIILLVAGVIEPHQALEGFSNPAPVSVAALYVIARAIEKSGVLQPLVSAMLGGRGGERRRLFQLLLPTAAASSFLNNTPIVAMLVPQVSNWARKNGRSPSRFLMPLSFAAILGGMVTLIGTSTNLVVSGLLEQHGFAPLGMFEITRYGLPVAAACLAVMLLFGSFLIPERKDVRAEAVESERDFVVGMRVSRGGPMVGRTVEGAGLRNLKGLYLAELTRKDGRTVAVGPQTVLEEDDVLTFVGQVDTVVELQSMRGLESAESSHFLDSVSPQHTFFEAVIGTGSRLNGKTLKEAGFRSTYHAAAVAIHRAGVRMSEQLGRVRLRAGDTLLLLADRDFRGRWRDRSDFLLIAQLGGSPPGVTHKAWLAVAITVGVIVVAGLGIAPIVTMALLGAMLIVLFGVLTPGEARASVDIGVVVAIAGAFGLAAAIESSGVATFLGDFFGFKLGAIAPQVAMLGLATTTILLTGVITNNASAALMFPVALTTASDLGADPRLFAIIIAIAASTSFLTPVAYQTNLMVYGPGGYRFGDYARLGIPLTVVVLAVLTTMI